MPDAPRPVSPSHPGGGTGRVLVACDKFKGSLDAGQVAAQIGAGLHDARPDVGSDSVLISDGGDGTIAAAVSAGFQRVSVRCSGPTGEPVVAAYARRGSEAVVEMATACGMERLPGGIRNALGASSRGLGEVIAAVLDAGVDKIMVGIGGSASTDGGAGMLSALGARLLDANDAPIADGGAALRDLARIDLTGLHPGLQHADITVACDVDNPLTGPHGAAAIFGPQKGASPEDVELLDRALIRLADKASGIADTDLRRAPGAGAAGGVGWALMALLGANMRPGIEVMLEFADFDNLVRGASLVITGEGTLDRQTLSGKAPAGVARAAQRTGVPVVAVCGRSMLDARECAETGITRVYQLVDLEPDPDTCIRDAGTLLRTLGARIGHDLDELVRPG